MKEPSILDYLKTRLKPWKYEKLEIQALQPEQDQAAEADNQPVIFQAAALETEPSQSSLIAHEPSKALSIRIPWRSMSALLLALIGQYGLSPAAGWDWKWGASLLIVSMIVLFWAVWQDEIRFSPLEQASGEVEIPKSNTVNLIIGALLAVMAFVGFGSLEFSFFNLTLLGISIWFFMQGFWPRKESLLDQSLRLLKGVHRPPWKITLTASRLLGIAAIGWVAFFRFSQLTQVPPEMNSDHAEKIIDTLRVLSGQNLIFFSNNGGREAIAFYLVAALHRFFGMPLNFMILKLMSSAAGFLALPFLYLLGKELGNRRVGLLAFLFAGIAYWTNVVSRFGLRLPFYMFFSAALLYFLVRGIRRANRNDIILAGIFLGFSFYGYSADRILPLLVLTAIGLFILHEPSRDRRIFAIFALLVIVAISFVIFLPTLRYILAEPQSFFQRTFTRMGDWERPISDPIPVIFLHNTGRALAMFSIDAGVVWPLSIPNYPALSIVSGALFYLGVGMVLVRYITSRDWLDLTLLVSIPILLLPSILSIAFPSENPNLYRTSGAFVPVFLFIALALDRLMDGLENAIPGAWGGRMAFGLAGLLLLVNSMQDYNLVFERYYQNYLISSWNSSEMGNAARDFIDLYQVPENVWVVGYPNWVDTRLVANNAGYPSKDYELKVENIPGTVDHLGPKMFILNPEDNQNLRALEQLYPDGHLELYRSRVATKDFLIYYVFPQNSNQSIIKQPARAAI
jgi:hypothetical protein